LSIYLANLDVAREFMMYFLSSYAIFMCDIFMVAFLAFDFLLCGTIKVRFEIHWFRPYNKPELTKRCCVFAL